MSTSSIIEGRIDKTVSAETGISATGAMAFANVAQIMEFAKAMSIAQVAIPKHLRDNPGACLAICIQASEWEMSPFAVANKSYSVNDRLAYEAQLINAVILKRAPIVGRFQIEYNGAGEQRTCKVTVKLRDGEVVSYESPPVHKITVKNSPLWKGDPDQQLFYYASRAMCRRHFPDVLLGVYTVDELQTEQMRDVSSTATARAVPLDPFNEPPQIEETAQAEEQPQDVLAPAAIDPEGDKLAGFCEDVDALTTAKQLNTALSMVAGFSEGAHRAVAQKKVMARGEEIGAQFNSKTALFVQP